VFNLAQEFAGAPTEGVDTRTLVRFLHFGGCTHLQHGERERATELFRQVIELGTKTRDSFALLVPSIEQIAITTLDGNLEEAVSASERLIARADELGAPVLGRQFANEASYALIHLGRVEEAPVRISGASEAVAEFGDVSQMSGATTDERVRRALLLAYLGESEQTNDLVQTLMAKLDISHKKPHP
jgi:hypothetical protein